MFISGVCNFFLCRFNDLLNNIMVQVEASRSYVKYATRIEGIQFAPFHIEKVFRKKIYLTRTALVKM